MKDRQTSVAVYGLAALLGLLGCRAGSGGWHWEIGEAPRPPVLVLRGGEAPRAASTSITPITNLSASSSGLVYSGESYDVSCAVATDTVTLYPVVHNGTAWEGPYQGYACTLDPNVATKGTCTFPARQGTGLTWNAYKTGSGSVSSCTATGRAGPVPATPRSSGGGGSGTVTSIDCDTGLLCTPDPIVATGTIAPDFGTVAGKVAQGGVVAAGSCAYPTTFTFNAAGQVTACTAGSAPGGGTVTSVGLSLPGIFTVSGSPVTGAGTLTGTLATQTANLVWAGPSSGSAAAPTFRALVGADLPSWTTQWWSLASRPTNQTSILTVATANVNTGIWFSAQQPITITGLQFWWAGDNTTIRCFLWAEDQSQITSVDVAVTGTGLKSCTFASSYSLGSSKVNLVFAATAYDTRAGAGGQITYMQDTVQPTVPFLTGSVFLLVHATKYGDVQLYPSNNGAAGAQYPLTVVYSVQ